MELHSSRERIEPPRAVPTLSRIHHVLASNTRASSSGARDAQEEVPGDFNHSVFGGALPHNFLSRCVLVSRCLLASIALSSSLSGCGHGGMEPKPDEDTDYSIELVFLNHGTPSQDAAFTAAANRWMTILQGELGDVDFSSNPVAANSCGGVQHPEVTDRVDDLRILVDIRPIDGLGGTLAQAGFCQIRTASRLPVLGFMSFDSEDLGPIEMSGDLAALTLHEMGHVIGVGTLWPDSDTLLVNPSLPSNTGADTHFDGAAAIAAFNAAGGTAYTGGAKVPVENLLGVGSADSHWRESVLENELMTPELQGGVANPLSAITTESLADLGYIVDSSGADSFTPVFSAPARRTAPRGRILRLGNDTYWGPVNVVDRSGRVTRTILRR